MGKTEIVNNAVGFFIHQDPSPLMVVMPTIQMAEAWSKTRLAPMLRDTPELRGRVADVKSRDSGNTILDKVFPGGILVIRGSNAPAGLSSQPIRVVLCDEVDRFEESAGTEGDPVDLAFKRTSTFTGRRKHVLISTPGIKGYSRIEKAWNESDQRHYFVPCPHCQEMQPLDWKQVIFDPKEPEAAVYACKACGSVITDAHKQAMLRAGEWIASRPFNGVAGFHLNELYSPWRRFGEVAADFIKAKHRGPESLKVWINTSLGETWDIREGEAIQVEGLATRARNATYKSGTVPTGVDVLVSSVDVQEDRLELLVLGIGEGEESWVIQHRLIPGNLAQAEPWDRLQQALQSGWPREGQGNMRIRATCCDIGGHFTKQVYAFCRRTGMRGRVHPIKGATKPQRRLVLRSGSKARLYLVDTVAAKDQILARLRIEKEGFGFIHFPQDMEPVFFEQLLSEKPVHRSGRRGYEKVTAGARNEALDLMVYASAALEIWGPGKKDMAAQVESEPEPEPAVEPEVVKPDPAFAMAASAYQRPMRMPTFGGGSGAW